MTQVEEWQQIQRKAAKEEGYVCTILGRRRLLPDAKGGKKAAQVSDRSTLHTDSLMSYCCDGQIRWSIWLFWLRVYSPSCHSGCLPVRAFDILIPHHQSLL